MLWSAAWRLRELKALDAYMHSTSPHQGTLYMPFGQHAHQSRMQREPPRTAEQVQQPSSQRIGLVRQLLGKWYGEIPHRSRWGGPQATCVTVLTFTSHLPVHILAHIALYCSILDIFSLRTAFLSQLVQGDQPACQECLQMVRWDLLRIYQNRHLRKVTAQAARCTFTIILKAYDSNLPNPCQRAWLHPTSAWPPSWFSQVLFSGTEWHGVCGPPYSVEL